MRIILSALLLLWLSIFVAAQEKEQWRRVYTLDDATIEMNAAQVTYGERKIGRVTFRWTWSKLQRLGETPEVKYKTRLEITEFRCEERRYRTYETRLLDSNGKTLRTIEQDPLAEWKAVKFGSIMEKLFNPACALIESKRRKPQTDKQEPVKTKTDEQEPPGRPVLKRRAPPREP